MKSIYASCLCIPLILYVHVLSCKEDNQAATEVDTTPEIDTSAMAEISSVTVSGNENDYTFNVGIKSPDTGCDQYADWWEIISETGDELLYRRILAHSHVTEQPFVRSGGPVTISNQQIVYIRAHMNTSGYGSTVYKGSVNDGFTQATLDTDFANQLKEIAPLPNGCAF